MSESPLSAASRLPRRWLSRLKRKWVLMREFESAQRYSKRWDGGRAASGRRERQSPDNDLKRFFDGRTTGPGLWKWLHYFEIYERHLAKFRGRSPVVLEIGVYSGGSLDMWSYYFGSGTSIFGVDIESSCRTYERPGVKILIGDQADRQFWRTTLPNLPPIDIVIDDGGHLSYQQIVSLQELLPIMAPGGVYICEDVHGLRTDFAAFVGGLADSLNQVEGRTESTVADERIRVPTSRFQSTVRSVSWYPFMAVIEMNEQPVLELRAPKHGTQWEPFLA